MISNINLLLRRMNSYIKKDYGDLIKLINNTLLMDSAIYMKAIYTKINNFFI